MNKNNFLRFQTMFCNFKQFFAWVLTGLLWPKSKQPWTNQKEWICGHIRGDISDNGWRTWFWWWKIVEKI